jgi:hypothetical protein
MNVSGSRGSAGGAACLVDEDGGVRFHRRYITICPALMGEHVGFEEVADGRWALYFHKLPARPPGRARTFEGGRLVDLESNAFSVFLRFLEWIWRCA